MTMEPVRIRLAKPPDVWFCRFKVIASRVQVKGALIRRSPRRKELRCHLPLDPKMLFDRGDALKSVINFLSVSSDVGHAGSEIIEIAPDIREFGANWSKLFGYDGAHILLRRKAPQIILRRHVLDNVSEHLPEFLERRFLCPHT